MLSMPIDRLVAAIVNQELIGKRGNDSALHFHFSLQTSVYVGSKTYSASRALHLLYHLPRGYASVSVFGAVLKRPMHKIDKVDMWDHLITHDSEWARANIFSNIYFDMAREVNEELEADNQELIAPINMSTHNGFGLFGPVYDWVSVVVCRDTTDEYNYRKLVKVQ